MNGFFLTLRGRTQNWKIHTYIDIHINYTTTAVKVCSIV